MSMSTGKIVGIDLGTANSLAAVLAGGEPVVITMSEGSRLLPSVVSFIKTGEQWVSPMFLDEIKLKNNKFSLRRFIGQHFGKTAKVQTRVPLRVVEAPVIDGFVPIPPIHPVDAQQEVSSRILQNLKQAAEAQLGEPVTEVVITVPEYFTDLQRQATQAAGKIAGLKVLRILNEPAVLMDGMDKKRDETNLVFDLDAIVVIRSGVPLARKKDKTILVFDLGGKTMDVSVLNMGKGVVEVKATRGDTHLGGNDWDAVLAGYIADEFNKKQDIDLRMDSHAFQWLDEAAEKAKIELSSMLETEINLPSITVDASGPQDLRIKITRAKFEQLCGPLIIRCRELFETVLCNAKCVPEDLDELVLIGGATRMPMIQQLVSDLYLSDYPDAVVAAR